MTGRTPVIDLLVGLDELEHDDDLMWNLADLIADLLGFDDFVIYLRYGDTLVQVAAHGVKEGAPRRLYDPISIPVGHAIVGRAAADGQTILTADTSLVDGYVSDHFEGRSELTVPITRRNRVIAVFDSECEDLNGFTDWQIVALERMALVCAPVVELWSDRTSRRADEGHSRSRAAEALATLAGSVAHDLNNLLGIVELNAELLRRNPNAAASAASSLSSMVDRARLLTGRLLALTASGDVTTEVIEVGAVLADAAQMASLVPGVQVAIELSDELPLVQGDGVAIPQAVFSMVTNAVEATRGHGHLVIEAKGIEGDPPRVQISVSDDGPGVRPDHLDRIFDAYFSTKVGRAGLGLASSYRTALRHGGDLALVSTPGDELTRFELTLPAVPGRLVRSPPPTPEFERLTVLVLDDDPSFGDLLTSLLDELGHQHDRVRNGDDAVEVWKAGHLLDDPYDVALFDLGEDADDAGEALRRIRLVDPTVRAVAMTASADHQPARLAELGFLATVRKPFRAEELAIALLRALTAPLTPAAPRP